MSVYRRDDMCTYANMWNGYRCDGSCWHPRLFAVWTFKTPPKRSIFISIHFWGFSSFFFSFSLASVSILWCVCVLREASNDDLRPIEKASLIWTCSPFFFYLLKTNKNLTSSSKRFKYIEAWCWTEIRTITASLGITVDQTRKKDSI